MSKQVFHITTGDIDGIGLEVSLKAIKKIQAKIKSESLIIWMHQSQKKVLLQFLNTNSVLKKKSALINSLDEVDQSANFNFLLSRDNTPAHWFIDAVKNCLATKASVITAPLSKTQIKSEGLTDIGHTEILKRLTKNDDLKMCFFGKYFSVILYSDHVPIHKVKVEKAPFLKFLDSSKRLHDSFKNKKSAFQILGLNPHAGDSGIIGDEDQEILSWANQIIKLDKLVPADSAFVNFKSFKNNPTYVSFYHDQGLIPFKMAHGFAGFHYTMGLPFIRTSVDHGTAKEIFNKNKANPESMSDAILAALTLAKKRSSL